MINFVDWLPRDWANAASLAGQALLGKQHVTRRLPHPAISRMLHEYKMELGSVRKLVWVILSDTPKWYAAVLIVLVVRGAWGNNIE